MYNTLRIINHSLFFEASRTEKVIRKYIIGFFIYIEQKRRADEITSVVDVTQY